MKVDVLADKNDLTTFLKDHSKDLVLLYFYTNDSAECNQITDVIKDLSTNEDFKDVYIYKIDAIKFEEISKTYAVTCVPSIIFIQNQSKTDQLVGANIPMLIKKIKEQVTKAKEHSSESLEELNNRLKKLINQAPCMLFMKGSREEPKCGFSRKVIQLLDNHSAKYETYDILEDTSVREGLKKFSNWPTYPQLYINGELIGGLDILTELSSSGELSSLLPKSNLNERLKGLINRSPIMVFMKGTPDRPRCGFSNNLITMLNETGVKYDTFDILDDNDVREGLKKYSNWPTYPQVYVNGNLIGGFDIIKELYEGGELVSTLEGK